MDACCFKPFTQCEGHCQGHRILFECHNESCYVSLVKALQKVIANTILDRQLQQHLGREGFSISQLDASFDRQAIYSSSSGAFSVDVSEVFEVRSKLIFASMLWWYIGT